MRFRIGPVIVHLRGPVHFDRMPPKSWMCVNAFGGCPDAYGKRRYLTDSGRCPRCHQGLRRFDPDAPLHDTPVKGS